MLPGMTDPRLVAETPESVGIDPEKLEELFQRAEREVREGLLPSRATAIWDEGKLAGMRTVAPDPRDARKATRTIASRLRKRTARRPSDRGHAAVDGDGGNIGVRPDVTMICIGSVLVMFCNHGCGLRMATCKSRGTGGQISKKKRCHRHQRDSTV